MNRSSEDFTKLWGQLNPQKLGMGIATISSAYNDVVPVEGTTGFFRYSDIIEHLVAYLLKTDFPHTPKVLIAPCSVGCEPYSFAMCAIERGLFDKYPDMKIYAQDINPLFMHLMRVGVYPEVYEILKEDKEKYGHYFKTETHRGKRYHRVDEEIKSKIAFLPPQDLASYRPGDMHYDVVLTTNLLMHFRDGRNLARKTMQREEVVTSLFRMGQLVCTNDMNAKDLKIGFQNVAGRYSPLSQDMQILPEERFEGDDPVRLASTAQAFRLYLPQQATVVYRHRG